MLNKGKVRRGQFAVPSVGSDHRSRGYHGNAGDTSTIEDKLKIAIEGNTVVLSRLTIWFARRSEESGQVFNRRNQVASVREGSRLTPTLDPKFSPANAILSMHDRDYHEELDLISNERVL